MPFVGGVPTVLLSAILAAAHLPPPSFDYCLDIMMVSLILCGPFWSIRHIVGKVLIVEMLVEIGDNFFVTVRVWWSVFGWVFWCRIMQECLERCFLPWGVQGLDPKSRSSD